MHLWNWKKIIKYFLNFSLNPKMFPKNKYNCECRKLVSGDFLVFYRIDEENNIVRIYRILHGKRSINTILEELQTQD